MISRRRRLIAGFHPACVAFLVLVLFACSSDANVDEEQATATSLDAFWGEVDADRLVAFEIEEAIEICMRENGLEYKAYIAPTVKAFGVDSYMDDLEWARVHGYGITTTVSEKAAAAVADPNLAIQMALQPAEREQFELALYGDTSNPSGSQGCRQVGFESAAESASASDYYAFANDQSVRMARLQASEEVQVATFDWARCMKELGWDFNNPDEPVSFINMEFQRISAKGFEALQGTEFETDPNLLTQAIASGDMSQIPGPFAEDLDQLVKQEVELAVADQECFQEHVAPVYLPRLKTIESELIEEHKSTLLRVRDLAAGG